jgi:hypothetical protein
MNDVNNSKNNVTFEGIEVLNFAFVLAEFIILQTWSKNFPPDILQKRFAKVQTTHRIGTSQYHVKVNC